MGLLYQAGRVEMKVIRDETGRTRATFAAWEGAIDQAWQHGAVAPDHVVSDGDRAIAAGLEMVYGREEPPQLCHFHVLWECRRNPGWAGGAEARRRLASVGLAEGQRWARRVVALTGGSAEYWRRKALRAGRRHLQTGARAVQDHLAAGTAEPRVPASGTAGNGMVAPQLVNTAPKARPDQPNHLKLQRYLQVCCAIGAFNSSFRTPYLVRGRL